MAHFGMNLRVTMDSKQGGRKYMEDVLAVKFQKTDDGRNIEYTYLAVFDGHGGVEAAKFAKEHLLTEITKLDGFWSDDDEEVTQAIREGFLSTHKLMWKAVGNWPKTLTGYPSTAGTTASVVFIRNGKMYVAHVGDSTVVMGMKQEPSDDDDECPDALVITDDHKPDAPKELKRIEEGGGQVMVKAGVQRVVWHRPKVPSGPVRRSTNVDSIPFLAIARALGDLWSYNAANETFVVSPDPDIATYTIDLKQHKFVILASDGLWNMVKPQEAVDIVHELDPQSKDPYLGRKPASMLLHIALDRWSQRMLRADNTSVIVAYFDPPGITKDGLLRQPSDHSIASTLKATSDGEDDDDDDAEMDEIFPSSGYEDEESKQATGVLFADRRKPMLKRMTPSPANLLKHNRSSPLATHSKSSKKGGKKDAENDPNKVSILAVSGKSKWGQKRAASDDGIEMPRKRAQLASPESNQVADSPFGSLPGSSRQPLHCSIPLQVELSPGPSTSSSPSTSAADTAKLISPLWPSHLGDDFLSDNANLEPVVNTLIKPMCGGDKGGEKGAKGEDSGSGPSPLASQNKSGPVTPSSSPRAKRPQSPAPGVSSSSRKSRSLSTSKSAQRCSTKSPAKLSSVNRLRTVKKPKA